MRHWPQSRTRHDSIHLCWGTVGGTLRTWASAIDNLACRPGTRTRCGGGRSCLRMSVGCEMLLGAELRGL